MIDCAMRTAALDFFLPCLCPACHVAPGPALCAPCLAEFPRIAHPCPKCAATRTTADGICDTCADDGLPNLDSASAAFAYLGAAAKLIGDAKAGARPAAVAALAQHLPLPNSPVDAVIPVPPSPGRRPGPHLATACAQLVALRLSVPLMCALRCRRHAREQHSLSRSDRARNVADLFICRGSVPARVLLVDDILTSGATASAAAAALRAAGARKIIGSFICRTP